jgi:nucleoside-diphosphate-sugar epimerase
LVTGAAGLIGSAVGALLRAAGATVLPLDLRGPAPDGRGDFRDRAILARLLAEADGVLHFAAISRVIDGERNPDLCWSVNAEGTRTVLELAGQSPRRPWVVYASSREVYGQQDALPVHEDAPLKPKNIYARSKAEAERLMGEARAAGQQVSILRFSNVYGATHDHADRVVPAFARAAAMAQVRSQGAAMVRVDGSDCTFDFTDVDDVADGVMRLVRLLGDGETALPPIHFVSGRQTSLGELAQLAVKVGGPDLRVVEAPARGFDVHRFAGDPARAEKLLGWRATTSLEAGFASLAAAFRAEAVAAS